MSRVPEYTIKAVDNCIRLIIHHRNEVISALQKESFLEGLNWDDIDSDSKIRNPYIDVRIVPFLFGNFYFGTTAVRALSYRLHTRFFWTVHIRKHPSLLSTG